MCYFSVPHFSYKVILDFPVHEAEPEFKSLSTIQLWKQIQLLDQKAHAFCKFGFI